MIGLAIRECRRHHEILGARDGDGIQHQPGATQSIRTGPDVTAFDRDVRAHGLKAGDMDVHGSRADGAAARQGDVGASETRDQRAEHQDRGAHGLHQLIGCKAFLDRRAVDLDPHPLVDGHCGAHAPEQLHRGGDVLQMRHVGDDDRVVGQQRRGEDGQRGVLGARDAHFALERHAALNLQLVHSARRPDSSGVSASMESA